MSTISKETKVGDLVAEKPGRARILERYGIDYCCGGSRPLEDACREKGLDIEAMIADLEQVDSKDCIDQIDLSRLGIKDLADHIVSTYHVPLRNELPRLTNLLNKVVGVHGDKHPELKEVQHIFEQFRDELEMHMQKEELILFPMLEELERAHTTPVFHCGSIDNPIRVMLLEHDQAGEALRAMRKLTGDYTPPADACNSFRALLDSLSLLEAEMHAHVHLENNVLFPAAKAKAQRLAMA